MIIRYDRSLSSHNVMNDVTRNLLGAPGLRQLPDLTSRAPDESAHGLTRPTRVPVPDGVKDRSVLGQGGLRPARKAARGLEAEHQGRVHDVTHLFQELVAAGPQDP